MKLSSWLFATSWITLTASALTIPNPSFEQGKGDTVPGWTLTRNGYGRLISEATQGKQALAFIGDGKSFNYWLSKPVPFRLNQPYKLTYSAKCTLGTNGSAVTGPVFANNDIQFPNTWTAMSQVFVVPQNLAPENYGLRFGNWFAKGTFMVDDLRVTPVQPVYYKAEGITLGDGEKIDINEYTFIAQLGGKGGNHSRTLLRSSAAFNSYRWCLGKDSEIIYVHDLGTRQQLDGTVSVNIGYYHDGKLALLASKDLKTWTRLALTDKTGLVTAKLPASLFPAKKIYIRLQAVDAAAFQPKDSEPGAYQITSYSYKATLTGQPTSITGSTAYVEVDNKLKDLSLSFVSLTDCIPGKTNFVTLQLTNHSKTPIAFSPVSTATQVSHTGKTSTKTCQGYAFKLAPADTRTVQIPFDVPSTGDWTIRTSLTKDTTIAFAASVPQYLNADYGHLLKATPQAALWSASSGWKINPERAVPQAKADALRLSLAANEVEALQLVVTPQKPLKGVTLKASALTSPAGSTIPAANVEILSVYYHDVQVKTDGTGYLGLWPDALPPIEGPITLTPHRNHPFWLRVTAPKGTPAGTYEGSITVADKEGWKQQIPLRVTVFNFALPDTMTCETAFGFNPWNVWKYQNITKGSQRRDVYHKYMTALSKHHISPYNPAQLDPFNVTMTCKDKRFHKWSGYFSHDVNEKAQGKGSLLLQDNNPRGNNVYKSADAIRLTPGTTTLSFQFKSPKGNTPQMAVSLFSADNTRKPVAQTLLNLPGTGQWTQVTQQITNTKNAATLRLELRPATWTARGENTGKAWFDQLSLTDDTGKVIFKDDFEPIDLKDYEITIDWTNWDKAMEKAFNDYHVNCFSMPIRGLGGGTFETRREPVFFHFQEQTREYEALHPKYLKMLQQHLTDKGWLDKAYVYWFDEPAPRDYDFVMKGFRKLSQGAPGIRRMLTEQVEPELYGGPNLWCPVSCNLDETTIQPRKQKDEMFWWYVCCGPKAPYATLFIDHPGTEMRVWLWQTWQRGIQGVLVWQTNYWTSPSAYPDPKRPQNPYLDPMGWSAGSASKPRKVAWGNGDGKFLYPPLAAAKADSKVPILDGPVDSFRLEMLRDGIEDYEYFVILDRLITENRHGKTAEQLKTYRALLQVPETISTSLTQFTTDPQSMENHRLKLAQAIEELH